MAEALKHMFNPQFVAQLSAKIAERFPNFDQARFENLILDRHWEDKSLKERLYHIAAIMTQLLPFANSVKKLSEISQHFSGFESLVFPSYVELAAKDQPEWFEQAMQALTIMTEDSSAEFAIRPFINRYPEQSMQQLLQWSLSDNEHHRRLASEGCRPRLPWAEALPQFKNTPSPLLAILENLKTDDSKYVQKSVANNLNDISKDHPQLVLEICQKWQQANHPNSNWVIKHACRTLLKAGHPKAMALFGYTEPSHVSLNDFVMDEKVEMGQKIPFSFEISTDDQKLGLIRVEYAVTFKRKHNKTGRKVFKIAEGNYVEQQKRFQKKHSFEPITTRVYYPGEHSIQIIINGIEMAQRNFELLESKKA